jgi:phosphoglycolate phosphatase
MPERPSIHGRELRAVLLDWDGTLVDSHGSLFAANAAVMRAFDLPFDEGLYRLHYTPDWRLMYQRLGLLDDDIEEANRIWEEAYDGVVSTTLYRGADDALRRLHAAGIPLGLVTAGPSAIVWPQIERLGLGDVLDVRVFGDDLVEQKPDPAPLRLALARIGAADDPASVAFLGDAPDDMRMARSVGAHGIGIPSRLSDRAGLIEAGAEDIAASVAEWAEHVLASRSVPG